MRKKKEKNGITIIGDDRIKAIEIGELLPDPKNIKELRSLLGTLDFVRRLVPEYRLTDEYICAESARLVLPWHLRGRTVQLITCGTVQLFFDFLLHLTYFCYKYISIFLW